jgi:hypothetical protein
MINKRDFLKQTAAATTALSAAGVIGPALATVPRMAAEPVPLKASIAGVVYDARYSDTRAFAAEFGQRGVMLLQTDGDAARLWQGPIKALLDANPSARLAGLTSHADLAVLQTLGAERSLATLYEGWHDCRGSRTLTHMVHAGPRAHDFGWMLREAGADWPPALAHAILTAPLSGRGRHQERIVTTTPRSADNPGALVSWVIG